MESTELLVILGTVLSAGVFTLVLILWSTNQTIRSQERTIANLLEDRQILADTVSSRIHQQQKPMAGLAEQQASLSEVLRQKEAVNQKRNEKANQLLGHQPRRRTMMPVEEGLNIMKREGLSPK